MKIKELIEYGKNTLNKNEVQDSSIISRILAEYILNFNRQEIIANIDKEVKEEQRVRYYLALIEIIQGMPIQYITNKQEFMKLDFYVDENVLIPQPDTEILVEKAIEEAKKIENVEILDMCTGSGCIGISIAKNIKNAKVTLVDISENVIEIAKKNALRNKVESQLTFIQSNMFEKVEKKFDIIVSNPPYIKTDVIPKLDKQVQNEPHIALDGGKDGLKFYKIIIEEAKKYLKENGKLILEIGYDQKEEVENLIKQSGQYKKIEVIKDLSQNDRVIIGK